jgi:acetolactate synthase I/II/III large subunit
MDKVDGGALVCRILKEQNVKYVFAIGGGHVMPIIDHMKENGIQLIHMRHEQAAAYAADAWSRVAREPGVCLVTAGCGLTNAITGLHVAAATNSSVVCLSGQHPNTEDCFGSFQEAYGSDLVKSFAKYAKRVTDWSTISRDLRMAFRAAMLPPQGVSLLEIPINILVSAGSVKQQRPGGTIFGIETLRSQGDPLQIERAVDLLYKSKRPLLAGGDGVFWSGAEAELIEIAELTNTPVYCRRSGQGALDEAHPLAVRGVWKKAFSGAADLVVAVGFKFWSGEKFGQPPTWSDKATYVQIDSSAERVGWHVPAEIGIVGDPKLVLRQMIDKIKQMKLNFEVKAGSEWNRQVGQNRKEFEQTILAREKQHANITPIHPDRIVKDLVSTIDKDAIVINDSFTLSGYLSQWLTVHSTGQMVDAGPFAPVGAGVGMGIGAKLASPKKQVIVVSGDGGIGIGGMDLETAARYELPIIVVLYNNSSWGPNETMNQQGNSLTGIPLAMLPDIRYDKVFEPLGVHGELVEQPDDIIPALERSLSSGKPALINVIGSDKYGHPTLGASFLGSTQV